MGPISAPPRPALRASASLAATLWLAASAAVSAQEASPIPVFNGGPVYVVDVPDRYEPVAAKIREVEARSPVSYYVAVIRSSGGGSHATRDYADRLRESWLRDARSGAGKLDPDRAVIVVAALENHQIVVLPGPKLVDEAGLTGSAIDRRIVEPRFVPKARAGDFPAGLVALVEGVDEFVTARQAEAVDEGTPATTAAAPPSRLHGPSGRELAWSLGGSFVAIALMIGALIWLGRRRARGAFNTKLKDYKTRAVGMMDRLDALKARLKSLPVEDPDFTAPMAGETLGLYEQAQADLRKLWDRWLEVMDVVDRAQTRGSQGSKALAEADELVSDGKVFDEVEHGAVEVTAAMDRLNAAHDEARGAAEAVEAARKEAADRIAAVDAASLPVIPYRPEVDRIAAEADRAVALLAADPIGAGTVLQRAKAAAEALGRRAGDVVARLEDGRKLQEGLTKLRGDVAGRRREGMRLAEDGGNPDSPAAQSDQALAGLQTALESGDPDRAAERLASAQSLLAQARGILDAVVAAKAGVERGLPEARRETRRLGEALAQYDAFEQELRRDFAPSSWQVVAGNLGQARALLDTFDRKAKEVEEAAAPDEQKYLVAARLLERLVLEERAVFQLMNGVGERLTALKGVREEARRAAREIDDDAGEVAKFFRQYDHVVGLQARASLKAAEQARDEATRTTNVSPPDWLAARQALAKAREEYGIARSQAQSDLDVYQLLTREYDQARADASRVEAFLAGHTEDRVAANQHYRHAAQVLDLVGDDSTRVGNEWPRLLDQVRGARADLDHSERLAREDIRLARQAEAEMAEAARTIREGRTFLSMGIALDTSPAEGMLNQAQGLYHSQQYEQAIRAAASSIQQVRQAHQWAVQQAYVRQMQFQADQRRRSVAMRDFGMGAAIGAAGAMMGGSAVASDGPADMPGPGPADRGAEASSTSWSSEAGETSW